MSEQGAGEKPDPRIVEANLRKAEADADAARVAVDVARREEEEARGELARGRRDAEARKAIAEAEKAARDAAVTVDPDLVRRQKEAEAKKAAAEADKAAGDAARAQLTALIPDFTKVQVPETKVTGTQPLFGSLLAHRALEDAATALVAAVQPKLPAGDGAVLITSDADLASSDAAYVEVTAGFTQLIRAADTLLAPPVRGIAVAPVLGAIATVLPGLVSMLAPRQSVSTYAVEVDTTAATAAVAGKLAVHRRIRLDDFRLVPTGRIVAREGELRDRRTQLVQHKLTQEQERSEQEALRAHHQDLLDDLLKKRDALPAGTQPDEPLVRRIEEERNLRSTASTKAKEAAAQIALVDDLLKAIDAFSVAIHATPQGGHRSPFVAAALHEELHDPDPNTPPPYAAVLYLKASSGSADQVFKDRPIRDDQFAGVASISVSYWLIDVPGSTVLDAGVKMGTARIKGTVKGDIRIDPVT